MVWRYYRIETFYTVQETFTSLTAQHLVIPLSENKTMLKNKTVLKILLKLQHTYTHLHGNQTIY